MIDTNNIYLFHNVYGDADELILTAPENVIAIPYGWDEETEINRNSFLSEMNFYASCLPSVAFWVNETVIPEQQTEDSFFAETIIPAHWQEIRVEDMPKPWNWNDITSEINQQRTI